MDIIIKNIIEIINTNKETIDDLLKLNYEVCGEINLIKKTFSLTGKGNENEPEICDSENYPISSNIFDWHTHPKFDNLDESEIIKKFSFSPSNQYLLTDPITIEKISFLPSNMDLLTNLMASLYYNERVISFVIHEKYITFYSASIKLILYLNNLDDHTRKHIIDNYISHNISEILHETINQNNDDIINFFTSNMKKIHQIPNSWYGYYINCVPR